MGLEETLEWFFSDEFIPFLRDALPVVLDIDSELKDTCIKAKELVEDPEFWKREPGSRLDLIKEKLRNTGTDAHMTACILQAAYNANMNLRPDAAFEMLGFRTMHVVAEELRDDTIPKEPQGELEKKFKDELETTMQKSTDEADADFEKQNFVFQGASFGGTPEGSEWINKRYDAIREAIVAKFGAPNIPDVDFNPYPEIEDFVKGVIKNELGLDCPKYKLRISSLPVTETGAEYLHSTVDDMTGQTILAIPPTYLDGSPLARLHFASGISHELTHIAKGLTAEPRVVQAEERIRQFKRSCLDEGLATLMQERTIVAYLKNEAKRQAKENKAREGEYKVREREIFNYAKKHVEKVATLSVPNHMLSVYNEKSAHIHFSYWLGWYFLRQMPGPTIKELATGPEAWLDSSLPWNGCKVNKIYVDNVEGAYSQIKRETLTRITDTDVKQIAVQSFALFEKDWKSMNTQIVLK